MSKREQAALVAFFNSFGLSRRITSFDQLYDGTGLTEVMSKIDGAHFKNPPSRSAGDSRAEQNWVLRMNTLKRLYRLLLSYPLPSPHAASLALSSLPEPPFSTIAQTPTNTLAISGLVQISRLCLSLGVWAPGNEEVIGRIQGLGEAHMSEIMRSIQEVMDTMPAQKSQSTQSSPEKLQQRDLSSPTPSPTGLRGERDKLLQENDDLRAKCEQMIGQIADISSNLEDVTAERNEAEARFMRETASNVGLRSSQGATSDIEALRADLAKAEDDLMHTQAELEKQLGVANELTKQVEDFRARAAEASKLKDQLDEYRHAADKLQRTENVIEKYKKKLEDSAVLRREMKNLEAENAALINTNSKLEADLQKASASKALVENYRAQVNTLEAKANGQAEQIADMTVQLEHAQADFHNRVQAHERDLEELQLYQDKARETQLEGGSELATSSRDEGIDGEGNASLGDELASGNDMLSTESKTSLKLLVRKLQRELAEAKVVSQEGHRVATLETLLTEATQARDRYQADYLEARRDGLRLEANLEQLRTGRISDKIPMGSEAGLLESSQGIRVARSNDYFPGTDDVEPEPIAAQSDPHSKSAGHSEDLANAELRSSVSQDEVVALKDKNGLRLEEIKKLLLEKVDLQSSTISQRDQALAREREFSDIRATLSRSGIDDVTQTKITELHQTNGDLSAEIKTLSEKLARAKDFIRNQDTLFRADHAGSAVRDSVNAQESFERQVAQLKQELLQTKQKASARDQQYKLEQQLMLSAWHELGARTVRDHISQAGMRRSIHRPVATSWLGRQRKQQEDAIFSR